MDFSPEQSWYHDCSASNAMLLILLKSSCLLFLRRCGKQRSRFLIGTNTTTIEGLIHFRQTDTNSKPHVENCSSCSISRKIKIYLKLIMVMVTWNSSQVTQNTHLKCFNPKIRIFVLCSWLHIRFCEQNSKMYSILPAITVYRMWCKYTWRGLSTRTLLYTHHTVSNKEIVLRL